MAKPVGKKFGWVLKDFSFLSEKCYSAPVLIGDCRWRLVAFPKGNNCDYLSLYLDVADSESFPCGWRNYVKLRMTVANQLSKRLSILKEVDLFEVLGTMDASEKSDEASGLLSMKMVNVAENLRNLLKKTSPVKESNDVNVTKQVENSVKSRPKNKLEWTAFLIFVFFVILTIGAKNEELLVARGKITALEKLL